MNSLPFIQYLLSKQFLKESAKEEQIIPVSAYVIEKYCTIQHGTSKEESANLQLKPKTTLIVEWTGEAELSEPISFKTIQRGTSIESEEYDIFWNSEKFSKWLAKNASVKDILR